MADIMSWKDDMLAMGAKRRVRAPVAAKPPKTTDQGVAATNRNGSTSAFDPKQAADTAREYMQYRSVDKPSAADPNKAKQLPAKATTAAQTARVRVTAKPVASEAMSEQKGTSDADAELTARAARERYWHAGIQNDAQQIALEKSLKQSKAKAVQAAEQEALAKAEAAQKAKHEALAKAETAQKAKHEALAKAEAARKAVEELLAEEEHAAHQAAAKKAKKDRRKAKKQQQQEEELLQRQQQQQEEELLRHQHQQQEEEEQQRVQQEMKHQQQLQEEQKLQQQKQAKQRAQKQHAQKPQQQAQTLQGQEEQQKLQPQVQELQEDQTQQDWQEQQRQGKQQHQQHQKQQRNVEQPPLQMHTQQAGHAAGSSSTGRAASTASASKNSAAEQTELVLSPEPMHVKQSKGLGSCHRQTAKTVRLDHAKHGHDVGGQHERGVPTVDCLLVTGQQQRFAAPHHLLCCPITQVLYFLSSNMLSTSNCRPPMTVYKPVELQSRVKSIYPRRSCRKYTSGKFGAPLSAAAPAFTECDSQSVTQHSSDDLAIHCDARLDVTHPAKVSCFISVCVCV